MKHWWVPGLQIGYEHTFIHQFADFVEAIAGGTRRSAQDVPRRPADRSRHGRRPRAGGVAAVGNGRSVARVGSGDKHMMRRQGHRVRACSVVAGFDAALITAQQPPAGQPPAGQPPAGRGEGRRGAARAGRSRSPTRTAPASSRSSTARPSRTGTATRRTRVADGAIVGETSEANALKENTSSSIAAASRPTSN